MLEFIKGRIEYYSTMEKHWTQDFIQDLLHIQKFYDEDITSVNEGKQESKSEAKGVSKKGKSTGK